MMQVRGLVLSIILISLQLNACDLTNGSENDVFDPGEFNVSFTVMGEIEAGKTGLGEAVTFMEDGQLNWNLTAANQDPATFDLVIRSVGGLDQAQLSEGPYTIGSDEEAELFAEFRDEEFTGLRTYSTDLEGTGGLLTITAVEEDRVTGTFEFTASAFDFELQENLFINITKGEFDVPLNRQR